MTRDYEPLRKLIREHLAIQPGHDYARVLAEIDEELLDLATSGRDVVFAELDRLDGKALEIRVEQTFQHFGYSVTPGRADNLEDRIIEARYQPTTKLVLEIKSSTKGSVPGMDDLRQLDDWVFSLSGEEEERRQSLEHGRPRLTRLASGSGRPLCSLFCRPWAALAMSS